MAISPRLIRRRIKSVTNTRKITKAMELVAAAKMRRAVQATLASRPYAEAAWRAITEISAIKGAVNHPLLNGRAVSGDEDTARKETGRILIIAMHSDRGLCGGFNSQLMRAYAAFARTGDGAGKTRDVVAIGKKGQDAHARAGSQVVAAFEGITDKPDVARARPIAQLAMNDFNAGTYDEVWLAYTDFKSALTQTPNVKRLLPITRIEGLGEVGEAVKEGVAKAGVTPDFLFEPSPEAVLDAMLPRLVEAQIWQALLESSASFHSAQMMAMRSATDAAGEMIDDLTLSYNQARQSGITREIAEISSGKAALEK
ncbi:MAG: hypothetical protein RLZZ324_71 [Candidatus Parcubacteria bacterium]|jgi:F-type H+-transporting ATPase subunit gamma